ncbi:hypothetical protein CERSUDRAFT_97065 [Gelatoporia subvermispora B]|uniref:DUF6534 domain-containing protein n=1 Tax=Ceriporiopsis subvermispora (strain B) TaxID=914234 RepID=M2QDM3_CERS8|nr:hypothetical protein CERSUDRAFT_97065 [Gelatoporia subvermispora B]
MANPATIAHGPGLLGTILNVLFYGIMVTQTFLYYNTYRRDRLWMKLFVAGLFIADTVNSAFDIWWIYDVVINHFGDFSALETGNWVFATDPAMVGIIATSVQLFFAWRIKVLTQNNWIVGVVVFSAMGSIFGGLGTAIAIHYVPEFIEFQKFQAVVIIWLILAAICDTTITISLTIHLRRHRTGFAATDHLLDKIIRITVQNGLITALWAIADLITYLATPTGAHLALNFPLAKLYTNSLLSTLNSRRSGESYAQKTSETSSPGIIQPRDLTNLASRKGGDVVPVNFNATAHAEVCLPGMYGDYGTKLTGQVYVGVEVEEAHEMGDMKQKRDVEWSGDDSINSQKA